MTITREEYYRRNGDLRWTPPEPRSYKERALAKEEGRIVLGTYQGLRERSKTRRSAHRI